MEYDDNRLILGRGVHFEGNRLIIGRIVENYLSTYYIMAVGLVSFNSACGDGLSADEESLIYKGLSFVQNDNVDVF